MKKWVLLVMVALLAAFPSWASADSTPTLPPGWTGTYKKLSPDGQYVLVMRGAIPVQPGEEVSPEVAELNKLLTKYPSSGLYKNDGSTDPLWLMPYISWRTKVLVSSDGHHVVVWGEWPSDTATYSDVALTFYEDGNVLATYVVSDLVMDPEELPHSTSHYRWVLKDAFDDARGLLSVETYNHEEYTFDTSSGKVLSAVVPTVAAKNQVSRLRPQSAAAMSTVVPTETSPGTDYDTITAGLLLSVSSLTVVFMGVSILSTNARRKRADGLAE